MKAASVPKSLAADGGDEATKCLDQLGVGSCCGSDPHVSSPTSSGFTMKKQTKTQHVSVASLLMNKMKEHTSEEG